MLAYPVISSEKFSHQDTFKNLWCTDTPTEEQLKYTSIELHVDENSAPAYIMHTANDQAVNVKNSLEYAASLKDCGVDTELHIFPNGRHGLGLTEHSNDLENHVAKWSSLLLEWFKYIGW